MAWNVLLTARAGHEAGAEARAVLAEAGCTVTVAEPFGPLAADALATAVEGHEAVLASSDDYSAALFADPRTAALACVSRWGVGLDCVDLAAATRAGVVVCNTPGLLDEAVADYAWALLFAVARRVTAGEDLLRAGQWSVAWGHDVHGKTLGIVGCGRIGRAVARRAAGFGMRVLGHDPFAPADGVPGVELVPLERLLRDSDFVSLHCALSAANRGMIGRAELAAMKRSAYLVNTARGALVDDAALVAALGSGAIAGAALDAFAAEPLPQSSPLRGSPRLLITPHQAFNSVETCERVSLAAAEAIVDLMAGRRPRFLANPDVLRSPALRAHVDRVG
ncbi:MAG: hydroxyacid dehydrogenase [Planctomycetes bacterium]|nr:hydroxyacid dehydrogenase [Planctomycetota bacterium]